MYRKSGIAVVVLALLVTYLQAQDQKNIQNDRSNIKSDKQNIRNDLALGRSGTGTKAGSHVKPIQPSASQPPIHHHHHHPGQPNSIPRNKAAPSAKTPQTAGGHTGGGGHK